MWRRRQSPPQQGPPNQQVIAPVYAAPPRQRRHRLRSSGASNSSSLSSSCHSHQWVITPRPHYALSWKEGEAEADEDFLTVDKSVPSVLTTQSTWHEEAHWMSFQNALLKFTSTLTIQEDSPRSTTCTASSPVAASFDGSFVSAAAASNGNNSKSSDPSCAPPVRHIFGVQGSEENTFLGENSSASEGDLGRTCPSHHSNSVVGSTIISKSSSSKKAERQRTGNETDSPASALKTMASELSETKMRLALAQAERDELEFALLMAGGGEGSP